MRRLLILAVLLAGPATAQSVGDRYGSTPAPGRDHHAQASVSQPYSGRLLTWSGKVAAPPPPGAPPRYADAAPQLRGVPSHPPAPAPFQPQSPLAAPAPLRQAQAAPAAPSPKAPPAPRAALVVAAARAPPPTSLYDAAPRRPVLAGGPPAHAGTEARLYSLHREYGLQPDAIPEPAAGQRYVLVGPPDRPAAPRDDAKTLAGSLNDAPF